MYKTITIILFCLELHVQGIAQQNPAVLDPGQGSALSSQPSRHDSIGVIWLNTAPAYMSSNAFVQHSGCKAYIVKIPKIIYTGVEQRDSVAQAFPTIARNRPRLLKMSGNVLYDANYRSSIDTPYAEDNVVQHMVQTRLDFVYKEQYPFKVYVTSRFSNSNLFRKYTDMNLRYTKSDFERILKKRIIDSMEAFVSRHMSGLDSLRNSIQARKNQLAALSLSMQGPDLSQQLVQRREKELYKSKHSDDSQLNSLVMPEFPSPGNFKFNRWPLNRRGQSDTDSTDVALTGFDTDSLNSIKERFDSLMRKLQGEEATYTKLLRATRFNHSNWRKEIEETKNPDSLHTKLNELNMPDSLLPKGYKTLYAINSFNVGTSIADYSELSVKNINITGIQIEYNPRYYYALAAGKVDYRFRDYIVPNRSRSNQYLALARFGKGMKNGNHIIFTYYTGKRQFFNASISSQQGSSIPEYRLAGITMEGIYRLTRNVELNAEVAKSTKPYYSLDSLQKKSWMNSITRFNDRRNEAYALAVHTYMPRTLTRIDGKIGYLGADFQSFSTFTTGAAKTRWAVRAEQLFWKKRINLTSSIQQNEYNNPFAATSYESSSVLASIRAMLRIRKWPTVSLGYFPSYQLTKINEDDYSETRYYTLVANSSYAYRVQSADLTSYFVFSQFYNRAADSGFIYFNSRSYLVGQNATINRLSMLLNASISTNTDYDLYTIEHSDQFAINTIVSLGAGVKMIKQTTMRDILWGYTANMQLRIARLGDVQLSVDSGFIPSLNKQLTPNKMGRLTYLKSF